MNEAVGRMRQGTGKINVLAVGGNGRVNRTVLGMEYVDQNGESIESYRW